MYVTVSSSLGFWISWNVVSSSSSTLARVDLDAVLLPVLLRALEHVLAELLLGALRLLRLLAADVLRRLDLVCVLARRSTPLAVMLKFVLFCAFSTISARPATSRSTRSGASAGCPRAPSWRASSW